ncbi:MAG: hypothetical protein GF411_19360 [Candidatus Lokiarchaeota archaeon]|nr:hypothetical protein [Candidatus Lokiarchaeota archaeon]
MLNQKSAAIVIVILICSAGLSIFILTGVFQPKTHQESPYVGDVVIQEVSPFDLGDGEFIELQFRTNTTHILEGWSITDYDREPHLLPQLTGWSYLAIVTIFSGEGSSDLNATDGRATIYLNLTGGILDDGGDEVGLLDNSTRIVDFIRYTGGNSDIVELTWPSTDNGPSPVDTYESAQLFGPSTHSSDNWANANETPNALNALPFTTQDNIDVILVNGVDDILAGEIIQAAGPHVVRRYPGVNLSICREIHEMVDFTIHLLLDEGYFGPARASDGRLYVDVAKSNENASTGFASVDGRIRIWIGAIADKVELKATVEHEVAHMFQFAYRERSDNDLQRHYGYPADENNWWNEGFADYWGVESAKRNYNKTTEEVHAARRATGSSNWWDHGRDTNTSIFYNWSQESGWDRYQIVYQFMKFLMEEYGAENVSAIYHGIWYDGPNSIDNVDAREALEEKLGKTMDQILAEFYLWKILDREDGDIPHSRIHFNFTISDEHTSESVEETTYPGGALVQRVIVNGSYPIHIRFGGVENWTITGFMNNTDESITNFTINTAEEIVVNPEEVREITIIKIRGMNSENDTITFTVEQERSTVESAEMISGNSTVNGYLPYGTPDGSQWFMLYLEAGGVLNITMYAEGADVDFIAIIYPEDQMYASAGEFFGYSPGEFPRSLSLASGKSCYWYIHVLPQDTTGYYTMEVEFF